MKKAKTLKKPVSRDRIAEIADFVYKESLKFDTMSNIQNQMESYYIFPKLVLSRSWIRLMLFVNGLTPETFKQLQPSLEKLYEMFEELYKVHKQKLDPRFVRYRYDLKGAYEKISAVITSKESERKQEAMFLYSILDHMRWCLFEDDNDCPIDLTEFANITEKIYELAL